MRRRPVSLSANKNQFFIARYGICAVIFHLSIKTWAKAAFPQSAAVFRRYEDSAPAGLGLQVQRRRIAQLKCEGLIIVYES